MTDNYLFREEVLAGKRNSGQSHMSEHEKASVQDGAEECSSGQEDIQPPPAEVLFLVRYFWAVWGVFFALAIPGLATLALRLEQIDASNKEVNLGYIFTCAFLMVIISVPLAGQLSDRTRSRFGRRNPWIFLSCLLAVIPGISLGFINTFWLLMIAWALAMPLLNIAWSLLQVVIADRLPDKQRGQGAAVAGIAGQAGNACAMAFVAMVGPESIVIYVLPPLLSLICVSIFVFYYRESPSHNVVSSPLKPLELAQSYWINPFTHRDFSWAWLSRFLMMVGIGAPQVFQFYLLADYIAAPRESIPKIISYSIMASFVATVIASSIFSRMSDLSRRRKSYVIVSAIFCASGLSIIVFLPTVTGFFIGCVINGAALGVYAAVDQALVIEVLPDADKKAGRYLGIMQLGYLLAAPVSAGVGGLLLSFDAASGGKNYPLLLFIGVVSVILGALSIIPIRKVK